MFPLGSVVLPGELLPLHVFEPRYLAMISACLTADVPQFGTVLIERGREVGGGDQRAAIGTMARIVQVAEQAGGTLAVVAVGTRRIRVQQWLADDPYPRAIVTPWDDEPDDTDDLERRVQDLAGEARRVIAQAVELGDLTADVLDQVLDDATLGQLIAALPLGPQDRFELLSAAGPGARAALLADQIEGLEQIQRFRLGLPRVGE